MAPFAVLGLHGLGPLWVWGEIHLDLVLLRAQREVSDSPGAPSACLPVPQGFEDRDWSQPPASLAPGPVSLIISELLQAGG